MFLESLRARFAKSSGNSTSNPLDKSLSRVDSVDEDEYGAFLRQAQIEEEKAEKRRIKAIKLAEKQRKQINMSPWESRM